MCLVILYNVNGCGSRFLVIVLYIHSCIINLKAF